LLPIEQLLSEVAAAPPASAQKPLARPSIVGSQTSAGTRTEQPARPNFVSPFAADSARKGTPRQEDSGSSASPPGPRIVAQASQQEPVIMGSAAPATAPQPNAEPISDRRDVASYVSADAATAAVQAPQPPEQPQPSLAAHTPEDQVEKLRAAVLQALADGSQNFLASLLSGGEWTVQGNELVIKIAESQTVLDMSLSNDARRLAIASASGVLGRAVKLKVVPGASVVSQPKRNGGPPSSSGAGGRGRAEQDPVVRRMREKFGAEIRTVIDYRDKR